MAAKGTVKGDKEIRANLRAISQSIGGQEMDRNIVHALTPMKLKTQENAFKHRQPRQPRGGHLDEGVVIAKRDGQGRLYRVYWISFTKRARKLAHLLEFGTAPHDQPNRGIHHPGARAFPFFRPAFEETKEGVARMIGANVWLKIKGSIKGGRE